MIMEIMDIVQIVAGVTDITITIVVMRVLVEGMDIQEAAPLIRGNGFV